MTVSNDVLLALDVGGRRIGVARADSIGRIAAPLTTVDVDGTELVVLQRLLLENDVTGLVVGLPRNMSGEPTQQTQLVQQFVQNRLQAFDLPVAYQDESLTSVAAEQELQKRKKPYQKGDVDALAATFILQDYMEATYGY